MNMLLFVVVLIFSCIWTVITNKFLPKETLDQPKGRSKYDERQSKMFIEILAKSFIWLMYSLMFMVILRTFGWFDIDKALISTYPEIVVIAIGIFLLVFNYLTTRSKYTFKD
ncbi:hypothetical protein [Staphylococcus caeli]|uniref:Membrane protein n=1 Tax=Staphylococcus caeli TaxID=2201815 RepID=A0A1D4J2R0_9STAP|nr:hypothetical protein [Staphylococcus caeli]SCS37633.1 membrane protein [Staphylococcus caeli]SCS55792.1 membrane protein [Staphylococcus caeli]